VVTVGKARARKVAIFAGFMLERPILASPEWRADLEKRLKGY